MRQLSPHLFWHADSCSCYALVVDGHALLVDRGTRLVPGSPTDPPLPDVERLLLTHFHRDQCAAASRWHRQGAGIVIPFAERRFLEEADLLRASFDTCDNYTSYYPCFGLLKDVEPVDVARDYETLTWRDLSFSVLPLPGHTFGSVGYLFEVDGRRVLACGDLLAAPNRLRDYYWCQWRYMDFQGHVNLMESLETVDALAPDLVLPGHGEPVAFDAEALTRPPEAAPAGGVGALSRPLLRVLSPPLPLVSARTCGKGRIRRPGPTSCATTTDTASSSTAAIPPERR